MTIREWVAGHPKGQRHRAIAAIADKCGVTSPAVRHWIAGIRQVPAQQCASIEQLTGVPREELRPDVFGPPANEQEAA